MPDRLRRARRSAPGTREDAGLAMVTTVMAMAIMMMLSLVVLDRSLASERFARNDQDWNAALSAAQAGLDDYVQRLNNSNGSYYVYTTTNPDSGNLAMGMTAGKPNWIAVPQAAGGSVRAYVHYDVDTTYYTGTSSVTANGNIIVTSTGKAGTETRTLRAAVRRSGFMDHMYFTDYETKDPSIYTGTAADNNHDSSWAASNCADRYWNARPPKSARNNGCVDIQFANDTLDGPVYSNDAFLICENATFRRQVTTAFGGNGTTGNRYYRTDDCSSGYANSYPASGTTFAPNPPQKVDQVTMPLTNAGLKAMTAAGATPRGCLYVGPTRITLKGQTMYVDSPWTKPSSLPSGCQLQTWVSIPAAGVVYVDDVPSFGTTDPNSWATSDPTKPTCPSTGNNLGYPISGEALPGGSSPFSYYGCKVGDVFVQEQSGSSANALDGRLTVAASNDVYITGNIDYLNGTAGQSLLGLIADGFVYFWHPVNSSGNNVGTGNYPSRVSACMISVTHSIMTQNYDKGASLGTLSLTGSIAQKYRGVVRYGTTGYAKNYLYDPRLTYDAPPHFLEPTSSSFTPATVQETTVAYQAG